ncbi:protein phosphatase 2C domain-containing protein [Amycolatopsis sp. CA-128772]|uniref:protein phosphatase 2C domain-containing protein n=1 Tax=Amycolatopsis sp. CA-128772 TaxID=2073159 RepID=UPI000CD04B0F|nr:protein phosphatase 2C domain-containing protein [Amycolatopsis sp. CA-128772]
MTGPDGVTAVEPDAVPEDDEAPGTADPVWRGEFRFTPFEVGDPGRAAAAPSYPDREHWDRPDTVVDGVVLAGDDGRPPLVLRAASSRGRGHRFHGKVRQDAYAFRCGGRFVVTAVADGLSSRPLSHVAAEVVARHGCHLVAKQLETAAPEDLDWPQILRVLAAKVLSAGRRELQGAPHPRVVEADAEVARELATTVLFAVADLRPADGGHPVSVFAYGDSSAWVLRSGARWEPLNRVKDEGAVVAGSATDALPYLPTQPPGVVRTQLAPGDVLVLLSDGLGDPLDDGTGPVAEFLAEHWRCPPEPLAFAAHVDFARRSHDDDRTAVALWPDPAGGGS